MGIDYYAQSIIGVRIPDPRIRTKVRGCKHSESNAKFCAECGEPMYTDRIALHPIVEALDNGFNIPIDSNEKLDLIWSTDQEEAYVGFFKNSSTSSRTDRPLDAAKVELPDINIQELKDALAKELKELYNEKNFGLWTILYCSY